MSTATHRNAEVVEYEQSLSIGKIVEIYQRVSTTLCFIVAIVVTQMSWLAQYTP